MFIRQREKQDVFYRRQLPRIHALRCIRAPAHHATGTYSCAVPEEHRRHQPPPAPSPLWQQPPNAAHADTLRNCYDPAHERKIPHSPELLPDPGRLHEPTTKW